MTAKLIEIGRCYGMETNVEKTDVMRISRQSFPVKVMIDQKQLENVESFKCLGSMLTIDGRCMLEIKPRIAMAKAAFNKNRALFTSTLNLRKKLEEETNKVLHLENGVIWC
jgi:AmiR/NasT family two-component response regulator